MARISDVIHWLLVFISIIYVSCESFDGRSKFDKSGGRSFVAPDLDLPNVDNGYIGLNDEPKLSEFNHYGTNDPGKSLVDSFKQDLLIWNFHRDSEVSSAMSLACQKCMIAGNFDCVVSICRMHLDVRMSRSKLGMVKKKPSAFATGTALHGDILCSLCKHTNDVMCTMKLCVDPERGQNARDSGVQCMNGFCRWEKEAMINVGFNNHYHAWWQPQSLYFFFDHVTKEIASAYGEFVSSTSQVINGLG
ncbi:hypothetical protein ACF0H5_019449 [Mactra antiquata]